MEDKKYVKLNDVEAYKIAFRLSNDIWTIVMKWEFFNKDTLGKQFVRAVDSVSANLAEGFGRYGKKDKIKFYRYAIGSVFEALDWNEKAKKRGLLSKNEYDEILVKLKELPRSINTLIKITNLKLTI